MPRFPLNEGAPPLAPGRLRTDPARVSVHELREASLTEARRRRENGNRLSRPECRDNRSYRFAVTWISCLAPVSISVLRIGQFFPAVVAESPAAVSPVSFLAPCSLCLCERSSLEGVNGYRPAAWTNKETVCGRHAKGTGVFSNKPPVPFTAGRPYPYP